MDRLNNLLTILTDWLHWRDAWPRLTTENALFQGLQEAVRQDTVDRVVDAFKAFVEEIPPPTPSHHNIAQALLTCAQIAALTGESAARLPDLLNNLDPNAATPDELACQAASLDRQNWQQFVHTWLYKLTWQPPLSAPWAWDVVTTMWGSPRPIARSESITSLLVVGNSGLTARLTLEQLSDEGQGVLYPDPATLSFVSRDDTFQESERNVVAYVRAEGLWRNDSPFDVRWKLGRQDGKSLTSLGGGSAGGAFALGLAKLLAGS